MIIKRLKYLAVCLLVLLNVVSTMGGNDNYKYYNSQINSSLCLSLKNNKLTDCCKQDDMQRIYVYKTGISTGIFHVKNFKRVLCYDSTRSRFKVLRKRHLRRLGLHRHRHNRGPYKLDKVAEDGLRSMGCDLHETMTKNGFTYISYNETNYLSLKKDGRVQKHRRRGGRGRRTRASARRFMAISEGPIQKITANNPCRA